MEHIYGLHTGNKDYFYVGRTSDLYRRLSDHIRTAKPDGTLKERLIHELRQAGEKIYIEVLQQGSIQELYGKEEHWRVNLEGEGYVLTNTRAGDDKNDFTGSGGPVVPWSVELFNKAEWTKGTAPGEKSIEKSCWLKGILFHRVGKSKLRMNHSHYGEWDCGGYMWDDKVRQAIAMLTPGSAENAALLKRVELRDALKPKRDK